MGKREVPDVCSSDVYEVQRSSQILGEKRCFMKYLIVSALPFLPLFSCYTKHAHKVSASPRRIHCRFPYPSDICPFSLT